MKLTAKYLIRVRNIAPPSKTEENVIELCSRKNGMAYIIITIDGQIEFSYSNQKFEASELVELSNLANSAHLIINSVVTQLTFHIN